MPEDDGECAAACAISLPLPPPLLPPPAHGLQHTVLEKSKFYKKVAELSDPTVGGCEELKKMIKKQQFRCGLVALWMAGGLLYNTKEVPLEVIVQTAISKGYTTLGEMFSAANMASLAELVFGCDCELLTGGMDGENRERILNHLMAGLPVLVPYDEDFNHEPCQRDGHRAHWAVISGVLLGVQNGSFEPDLDVPGLYHPPPSSLAPNTGNVDEIFLIAKQGKSLRYQLWEYSSLSRSNCQLVQLDPKRANDGNAYVLPEGGVQAGLCGKTVLLKRKQNQKNQKMNNFLKANVQSHKLLEYLNS
ncbi:actin maturation protease isoform X2 [Pyxicephalus adspersus]|uniref:actin maturation protease isoform X2 n=1 Tax=Pyxicephalus adspersus TaxID=30357 RepID=UPI003B5AEABA